MQTSNSEITAFLTERIAAGDFPSAVYLVSEKGHALFADALGNAVVEPQRIAASLDTIYDLASLTKPLITALLCARRVEAGELTLEVQFQITCQSLKELTGKRSPSANCLRTLQVCLPGDDFTFLRTANVIELFR